MDSSQAFLDRAFQTLQRSDPIPKLLPQVRLGRMPKDSPALAAITSSWLDAFAQVLTESRHVLDRQGLARLDPNPRIAVLVEAGILADDHPPLRAVRQAWASALDAAETRSAAL